MHILLIALVKIHNYHYDGELNVIVNSVLVLCIILSIKKIIKSEL